MTETALTVHQSPHLMPAMSMADAVERFNNLTHFAKEIMREGVDYGTVPGTNKPTLLKPGAEKLTTFFGLSVRFEIIEKAEDWTGNDHGGEPFFYYWFRCQMQRGDLLIAEADGSCNSMESKYRWRWVSEENIPTGYAADTLKTRAGSKSEFGFAVDKAETSGEWGKPAEYWQEFKDAIAKGTATKIQKKTRKGAEYPAWVIDTTVYRVPNEDIYSQVNTVQKMAQKRALVAATLLAVNASEYFTQDLEDLDIAVIDASFTVVPDNGDKKQVPLTSDKGPGRKAVPEEAKEKPADNGEGRDQALPVEHTRGRSKLFKDTTRTPAEGGVDSPRALLVAVNKVTTGYYDNAYHMLEALKKVTGDKEYSWPPAGDFDGYAEATVILVDHAEANRAEQKGEEHGSFETGRHTPGGRR